MFAGLLVIAAAVFQQLSLGGGDADKWIAALDADQTTKQRLHTVRTALLAARQRVQTLRCGVEYAKEHFDDNSKKIFTRFTGTLLWKSGVVKYNLSAGEAPGKFAMAVLRDGTQLFQVKPYLDSVRTVFQIDSPPSTISQMYGSDSQFNSLVDPAVHFGGSLIGLFGSNTSHKKASSQENDSTITITFETAKGEPTTREFSKAHDYLPTECKRWFYRKQKLELSLVDNITWHFANGVWVPASYEVVGFSIPARPDQPRLPYSRKVTFKDIRVNEVIPSSEFELGSLPLADGSTGIDTRPRPMITLVWENGRLIPLDAASRATKQTINRSTALQAVAADPASSSYPQAEVARIERQQYYLYWSDVVLATLAVISVIAAIVARFIRSKARG